MNIAGLNNSGKSDLLKLIVYETKLKSGQIWIHGYPVHRHRMRCYRMVGYCPQYDNLPAEFTPRQLLYIQALFQGHRKRDARIVTEALIRMLGLYQCCDRSVHVCTSGEERRMFYAFAVLSSPRLVCVDGVPAGLDPIAKRIILSVTTIMQSMGTSFLYTSLNGLDSETAVCANTRPVRGRTVDDSLHGEGERELQEWLPAGGSFQAQGQSQCQHVAGHLEPH